MRTRSWFRILALLLGLALFAAACGDDDDTAGTDTGSASEPADEGEGEGDSDFVACEVTDTGGVDDRSFNQTAFEGLERAADEVGFESQVLESQSEADFAPNIQAHLDSGCNLIITVGFLLGDATATAAEENPDTNFAIVDFDFFDADAGEDITYDNVRELTFATDEAAFLAGYLSAGMSETGKVGTYGGLNIPTVTIFMDGYLAGVNHYNEENGTAVEVLGWDGSEGLFTGDFEDQTKGRQTTESLLDEGADIIMPVAGPVGLGSVEAVRGSDAKLIWVDTDGCESVADACEFFLTSVQKKMDNAVYDTATAAADGSFESGLYVGTLENDGVAIAPYHEFEDEVPQELKDAIDELREQIIAGELETTP